MFQKYQKETSKVNSKIGKNKETTIKMTGRGTKRRGRPPKTPQLDRQSAKFNYSSMKKPKYLTESQFSTPSASRASSPQDSDSSRKGRPSTSRKATRGGRGRKRGGSNYNNKTPAYSRKGRYIYLIKK